MITDDQNQEISIESLGLPRAASDAHQSDDEIIAHLKQSAKKIEEWVSEITDREELHAIYTVAKSIESELSFAKIKALKKYIPDKDWLDDLG